MVQKTKEKHFAEQPSVYIFDLDGTLTNCDERVDKHITGKPFAEIDWDAFYLDCAMDKPNNDIITLFRMLRRAGVVCHILTGRSIIARTQTIEWLDNNGIGTGEYFLYMRPDKDTTPDHVLKEKWIREVISPYIPLDWLVMVDDRTKSVEYFRSLGIRVLQVINHDF